MNVSTSDTSDQAFDLRIKIHEWIPNYYVNDKTTPLEYSNDEAVTMFS